MLSYVLKKMVNNKWMVLCLLIGCTLVTALASSVPIYSDAIMQFMLQKDIENYQLSSNLYPGAYSIKNPVSYYYHDSRSAFDQLDKRAKEIAGSLDLPIETEMCLVSAVNLNFRRDTAEGEQREQTTTGKVFSATNIEDNITITSGRMYSKEKTPEGYYEAIVNERSYRDMRFVLDNVYVVSVNKKDNKSIAYLKIVGIFTVKDGSDLYWYNGISQVNGGAIINENLFLGDFTTTDQFEIAMINWNYALDYRSITVKNMDAIKLQVDQNDKDLAKEQTGMKAEFPVASTLMGYPERQQQLISTLMVLFVPVILMLSFYIFMVSQLIVENERNEISLMKSRGASNWQIFSSYLMECIIICIMAMAGGPFLGLFLCRIIGSSNGFMEFVQRSSLGAHLSIDAYIYSLLALVIFIVTMLLPVVLSSQLTIVQYKQKKSRAAGNTFWKRYFIDFLVLGVSVYGYFNYNNQVKMMDVTGVKGTSLSIDPLLFLVSTFFVIGLGLFFLRIYPYILNLIFFIGRAVWSPVSYVSFIQVKRSGGKEQFIMLFLILSLSIGLLNANAARTINKNIEDKVNYSVGSDIKLMSRWVIRRAVNPSAPSAGSTSSTAVSSFNDYYVEPNFYTYTDLPGVEHAAKVFTKENINIQSDNNTRQTANLMAIQPYDFGQVAWSRSDMLKYHMNDYLNLIVNVPKAVLLSTSLRDQLRIKEGDTIYIQYGEGQRLDCVVYAFVDYWPNYFPRTSKIADEISSKASENAGAKTAAQKRQEEYEAKQKASGTQTTEPLKNFIIINMDYLFSKYPMNPYYVWIKKAPGVTDNEITQALIDSNIKLTEISYADNEVVSRKNDPLLKAMNGSLTLGFVITIIVAAIGFLIYWILSIRRRVLQFGIFRAMGMSMRSMIGIICMEQLLISGVAIVAGIVIGGIASDVYVPLFQLISDTSVHVPPFRTVSAVSDYMKIYALVAVMLVSGFLVLGRFITKIKIDQALKLGED